MKTLAELGELSAEDLEGVGIPPASALKLTAGQSHSVSAAGAHAAASLAPLRSLERTHVALRTHVANRAFSSPVRSRSPGGSR